MLLPHNEKVYKDIKTDFQHTNNLLVVHGTGLGKSFLYEMTSIILASYKIPSSRFCKRLAKY